MAERAGWTATGNPADDRLLVHEALAYVYRPDGAVIWIRSPNPLLDGRVPDELIDAGEAQRVLDLLLALAEGVTS